MDNNELLILPDLIYPLIIRFFLLEDDFDYNFTLKPKTCKLKSKTPALTNRKTRSIIGFSKYHFSYINDVALLHQHMHKVFNVLQSSNYLDFSKAQKPPTYKTALVSSKLTHWIKVFPIEFDFFMKNET